MLECFKSGKSDGKDGLPPTSPMKKLETHSKAVRRAYDRSQAEAKEPDAKEAAVKLETRQVVHVLEKKESGTASNRYISHLKDEIATCKEILEMFPEPDGTGSMSMRLKTKYRELMDALDEEGKKMKSLIFN